MNELNDTYQIDKKAIKEFAIYAREKLIKGVTQKAFEFGITKEEIKEQESVKVNGFPLDERQAKQRTHLIDKMTSHGRNGFEDIIAEISYTWFNRFVALRFMEVNEYLPSGIRIFSSVENKAEPDVLSNIELTIDTLELNRQKVYEMQDSDENDNLFKYILVKQCNKLGELMRGVFERITDDTELLLPDHLLVESGVLFHLVHDISESDWKNVEIMGWCYQFYNAEIKDKIGGLKNHNVSKEELPIVTQLYTPKWIVEYMVQNSLGKIYDQTFPDNRLSEQWVYYLKSDMDNAHIPDFNILEDIKIFDPACGSGHILVYAFDLLFDMYDEAGYLLREIPGKILKYNLFGLDIDKRAVQITHISLWMKALEKNRRLLRKNELLKLNVYDIPDCKPSLSEEALDFFSQSGQDKAELQELQDIFSNGKQFGSLLMTPDFPLQTWIDRFEQAMKQKQDLFEENYLEEIKVKLLPVLRAALLLQQNYQVVITNPPYHNKYNPVLKKFMQMHYKDTKSDLYSAFMYRTLKMTRKNGYVALMSPFTWMFISSHEKLRKYILDHATISSLIQLEYSAFEEATVPICTFVLQNQHDDTKGQYIRLANFKGSDIQPLKVREAVQKPSVTYRYLADSASFLDIPGSPIAYWASEQVRKIFRENLKLGELSQSKVGMTTSDNNKFLRLWHEVSSRNIGFKYKNANSARLSGLKWFPYNKGGSYRKWYGNQDYLVNWKNNGEEIKKAPSSVRSSQYYFQPGITWSAVSSKNFGVRYSPAGFLFDSGGSMMFLLSSNYLLYVAFLCSKITFFFLRQMNPTINFQVGNISALPVMFMSVDEKNTAIELYSKNNIIISKSDWDSFETSWDFKRHPFLQFRNGAVTLEETYINWEQEADRRFNTLKANEEELNRIFIDLYGLQNELTPEESDDEVTVRRADRERDVKSFLSYCVGVMFGRYSPDEEGLIFAGGDFDSDCYKTYKPDKDNVIPITDDTYFEDDLVGRLISILKLTFGDSTLEANLDFIAHSLNMKSSETSRQRIRRYFLKEFYKDHVQIYKKRPIYWLFDSGKQNGFKALVYLHRYESGLVARVRTDYLHSMERKYEEEMSRLDLLMESDAQERDRVKAHKQKEKFQRQLSECRQYDQIVAHVANQQIELDLDDGVKVNYAKFQGIVVPQGVGKSSIRADLLAKI